MSDAAPVLHALPPDCISGLDGFIREWWVQPLQPHDGGAWQPLPVRNDFGLWLRQDPRLAAYREADLRLRARLTVGETRRITLLLNAFAGYRLLVDEQVVASPQARDAYAFDDLRHRLTLAPGMHDLVIEARLTHLPPVFAARIVPEDGVRLIAAAEPSETADAEAFRYYNARCAAVPQPRQSWRTKQDFITWQDDFRLAFAGLMPPPPGAPGTPLDAEVIERVTLDDHVRETVRITVEPDWRTDVYMLLPRQQGDGPWPGLLCLHGHGHGKDDLIGIDRGDPQRRATIDALREDYALRYVRRGYVTATPGMRLIGDRGIARGGRPRRDPCDNGYAQATMYGLVPAALDAWDARRTLDLLSTRPEVARDGAGARLGCLGLSYGGRATMNVAALDERVRVAVVSGAMNCFRERLTAFAGCGSQFVPGLFGIGDTPEVLASLAPRPLLLELGSRDGTSPALFAEEMAQTLRQAYIAAGAPQRLCFDIFDGEHWFSGRLADAWLDRWL